MPHVRDAGQPGRAVGQRGQRGGHCGYLGRVGQVGGHAADPAGPGDGQVAAGQRALRPEAGKQAEDLPGGLRRHRGPPLDRYGPAGDQCGGKERRRIRKIGLYAYGPGLDLPGLNAPRVGWSGRLALRPRLHFGAGVAEHLDRHGDVRGRRAPGAAVADLQALVEPGRGEQQPRDELRRGRGVERDGAAGQRPGAAHGEREGAPSLVVDHRAEFPQGGQHRTDRAVRGPWVAVEVHADGRQRGDRRCEAHDRARVTHVHAGVGGWLPRDNVPGGGLRWPGGSVKHLVRDCGAERGQRLPHEQRVPGLERPAYRARPGGEGGQHERAVGL